MGQNRRFTHGAPVVAAIRESVHDLNLTDVFHKKVGTHQGLAIGDGCGSDPSQTFAIVREDGGITVRDARGRCVKSETTVDQLKHTGRHTLIVETCDNGNAGRHASFASYRDHAATGPSGLVIGYGVIHEDRIAQGLLRLADILRRRET